MCKERPVYHIFTFFSFFNDLKRNTLTLDIEMYSNLKKVSKNSSYIAICIKTKVSFRHLEPHTVFVFVMLHNKVFLWSIFPSQSGQLKPQTEQKDSFLFCFVPSIYISLKARITCLHQIRKRSNRVSPSYINPSYLSMHVHTGYEMTTEKKKFNYNGSNENFFYSSINQYNLVEWF